MSYLGFVEGVLGSRKVGSLGERERLEKVVAVAAIKGEVFEGLGSALAKNLSRMVVRVAES